VIPLVGTVTVGREAGNTLALPAETSLSRNHARIEQTPGGWQVVDNNSTNGTFVNGQRIQGAMPIAPGDEIQMGAIRFRFEG
jgi:pSer/pThr/pTyr-binding forkhead associated (FHA) protein